MKRKESKLSMNIKNKQELSQKIECSSFNLTVTINIDHRNPLFLSVPQRCNMKILKSMILFHLKKALTLE